MDQILDAFLVHENWEIQVSFKMCRLSRKSAYNRNSKLIFRVTLDCVRIPTNINAKGVRRVGVGSGAGWAAPGLRGARTWPWLRHRATRMSNRRCVESVCRPLVSLCPPSSLGVGGLVPLVLLLLLLLLPLPPTQPTAFDTSPPKNLRL